jgi:hypothetical protein
MDCRWEGPKGESWQSVVEQVQEINEEKPMQDNGPIPELKRAIREVKKATNELNKIELQIKSKQLDLQILECEERAAKEALETALEAVEARRKEAGFEG